MESFPTLENYLQTQVKAKKLQAAAAASLCSIAAATTKIAELVARGPLAGELANGENIDDIVPQPDTSQPAAVYCIYGPQTSLVLTIGSGTHIFTLDPEQREYRLTAANVSGFRHWDRQIRARIDDCLAGEDGLRQGNCNMGLFSRRGLFRV